MATIQSGFWGLWNTVSSNVGVKTAVSTARSAADKAVTSVQEKGLVQSAIDSATVRYRARFFSCISALVKYFN